MNDRCDGAILTSTCCTGQKRVRLSARAGIKVIHRLCVAHLIWLGMVRPKSEYSAPGQRAARDLMSGRLTLGEAARKSGIGLDGLMKAIRAGAIETSRCEQDGLVILHRDLDRFLAQRAREAGARVPPPPRQAPQPRNGHTDLPASISRVREAFGAAPPPPAEPPTPEPAAPAARSLDHWCETYLIELRKIDWYLRKLEADAAWLDETLTRR